MPKVDLSFRIGGEAGQGVESSGSGFAKALTRGGLHIVGVPNYYSRIRGGHNYFTIRASDEPIWAVKDTIEVLLALDAESIARHVDALVPGGAIIVDQGVSFDESLLAGRDVQLVRVPLVEIAEREGSRVMVNTAALATAAGLVGFDLLYILGVIADNFGKKGAAIVEANERVARAAYTLAREQYAEAFAREMPAREAPPRLVIDANHAFAMGALMSGCQFVAGYPMTPASSVLEYMAQHGPDWGVAVKHAEDEIAAINMCVGAAHAGVRAMTSTSGGGFDLMAEGLSLAAMVEAPIVLYLASRPGPATGLATRTAQADLMMALYSGHGEFTRVLLAPHTPAEAFRAAVRAFNIAEKYQTIVLVLSDQYNATTLFSCDPDDFSMDHVEIDRGKLLTAEELEALESYQRYALTDDGVSPRAIPGSGPNAVYLATGNEHREDGHITEEADVAVAMLDKRMKKYEGIATEIGAPERYGPADADITLVSWGSSYGPVREAVDADNARGGSTNMVHFFDLWPFPVAEAQAALADAKRIVAVEGNATAQFAGLLHAHGGIAADETLLKYDGRGFTAEYILANLEEARDGH